MKWTETGNRHNVTGDGSFQHDAWISGLCHLRGKDRWAQRRAFGSLGPKPGFITL